VRRFTRWQQSKICVTQQRRRWEIKLVNAANAHRQKKRLPFSSLVTAKVTSDHRWWTEDRIRRSSAAATLIEVVSQWLHQHRLATGMRHRRQDGHGQSRLVDRWKASVPPTSLAALSSRTPEAGCTTRPLRPTSASTRKYSNRSGKSLKYTYRPICFSERTSKFNGGTIDTSQSLASIASIYVGYCRLLQ